jgi:hypothetical protein
MPDVIICPARGTGAGLVLPRCNTTSRTLRGLLWRTRGKTGGKSSVTRQLS